MTQKTDILIIGGGSIGLHAAYYLLKSGRGVTILEARTVAQSSSTGNAGHIVPSHIIPLAAPGILSTAIGWLLDPKNSPFGMKFSLAPAYLSWLLRFALSCTQANVERAIPALKELGLLSAENYAALIEEEHFDCSYMQRGLLFLYKSKSALQGGIHEAQILHQNGLPAEVLDEAAVHEREPAALPDVIGGVHFTGDSSLNPTVYLKSLAARVRELGAEICENTPVTGFETDSEGITRVHTPEGAFAAEQIVLAAGAWSPRVARGLGLNLPVQPARGYSLTVSATQVMPQNALLLGERRVAVTPMGGLLRFTGRLELSDHDTTPKPRHLAQIERAVREYIHLDAELDVQETWAGLRPTTPDGLPIIGFAPHLSNLILATGHAMLGLSLGPGTGQVVAELANRKKTTCNVQPLSLTRF
ncbi:MAG: FAD-dependent oxidoreductase [Anaerolineales bacterium]